VNATIYLEGGGDSKELHARCREGFRRLLESCGFAGRMPRLVACGGRGEAYEDFKAAHQEAGPVAYVALLVDSEEPVANLEETWAHLHRRDGWQMPKDAEDWQVLFMTTCMETWIVADRPALAAHYGQALQTSALPPVEHLEQRARDDVQERLVRATKSCSNAYTKGKRSFAILGRLHPATLDAHLPSFARAWRILKECL
jgi:hypothetical protein